MKIKEGFVLRSIGDTYMVVGEGLAQIDFSKIVSLNTTAAYLWKALQGKEFSTDDVRDLLLAQYDVDEKTASADAATLVNKWDEAGLLDK